MADRHFRFIHRDIIILLALCAIAVVVFLVTNEAAASNRELFLRDAAAWYEAGLATLDQGDTEAAIESLRRAAFIDDENEEYRLALARALAAGRQDNLARAELLELRELLPEDPEINVELARLEARGDSLDAAVRYYESALYGVWPETRAEDRSRLRVELIRYLLDRGEESTALAEILALTDNMPDTVDWQIESAGLFMAAGDPGRALDLYTLAIETDPENDDAFAGAGRAAFALDDFARARDLLARVPDNLPEVEELLAVSDFVLLRDPLAARLSTEQRRQRLIANVERVRERLAACADDISVSPALALVQKEVQDFAPLLEPAAFRDSSDTVETGIDLVMRVERAAGRVCAAPTALDRALEIIGRLSSAESS